MQTYSPKLNLRIDKRLANAVTAERCRRSYRAFVQTFWPTVEFQRPLVWGRVLDAVCEHLQAVFEGGIKRLIINIPPGHCKSSLCGVFWQPWCWLRNASWGLLGWSYQSALATRDATKQRMVIDSGLYEQLFKPDWNLLDDQNTKTYYRNSLGGERSAQGAQGGTGRRADVCLFDDIISASECASQVKREERWDWLASTGFSRLNDLVNGAHVLIGQRLHLYDPYGRALQQGGWEHLCLQTEFDPNKRCKTSIWQDWRTKAGELLFPERFPRSAVERSKIEKGPVHFPAQEQQDPQPPDAGFFKKHWFEVIDEVPEKITEWVRAWDLAATENGGDRTAGVLLGVNYQTRIVKNDDGSEEEIDDNEYVVADVRLFQRGPGPREEILINCARADGRDVAIFLEEEGGSSGKFQSHSIENMLPGYLVQSIRSTGSKTVRATPLAAAAANGRVKLIRGAWNLDYLQELASFPAGAHDDQVDATSLAFQEIEKVRRMSLL